ncbi:T9SS type A sorting domain-containing protein [Schleiferiaceae bacterium]|nr:T9SS type A sorting domain-containing protein [Schleiferiaceae bacterium]
MKKALVLILVFYSTVLSATHYLGGEISWTCESSGPDVGKFKFFVSLYRECGTGASTFLPNPVILSTNAPVGSISCNQVGSAVDISPNCYDGTQEINCNGIASGSGAVEMRKYESGFVTINGTPPAGGWYFTFTDCCRPSHVNLTGGTGNSYTLRAFMYPYTPAGSPSPLSAAACYDNSPKFLEPPVTVVASGGLVVNNLLGYDKDYDSLYYDWAHPQTTNNGTNAVFTAGYAFNNPFPSINSVSLNPTTGQLSFNPNVVGSFASCVQIDSYRQGQKIASTFRDYPLIISSANTSNTPPFISIGSISPTQSTGVPQFGLPDSSYYYFNVTAGDSVRFKITGTDANLLPNFLPQTLTWQGTSAQLGGSPTVGCDHPPCATATPFGSQTSYSSPLQNEIRFDWLTSCENYLIDGYNKPAVPYVFVLKYIDNACSVPASMTIPVVVNVFPPVIGTPDSVFTNVVSSSNTEIHWTAPTDTSSNFSGYLISFSDSITGPYLPIDTVYQYTQTQYSVNQSQLGTGFITVQTLGPCDLPSLPSTPALIQNCAPTILVDLPSIDSAFTSNKLLYVIVSNCISDFQWQLLTVGGLWQNLQDTGAYSGALTSAMLISGIDSTFNGNQYRCLLSGSGLIDTSNVLTLYTIQNINIQELSSTQKSLIFPNPNDGYFTIEVGEAFVGASYEIVDGMGRQIERGEIQSQTQAFNLADKPKGVYRIALIGKSASKTMIVVIQ